MTIVTNHVRPPIPLRGFEWSAIDSDTYDYDSAIGWGETEQQAIDDLLDKLGEDL